MLWNIQTYRRVRYSILLLFYDSFSGKFGKVFHVKDKVSGLEYAAKFIKIRKVSNIKWRIPLLTRLLLGSRQGWCWTGSVYTYQPSSSSNSSNLWRLLHDNQWSCSYHGNVSFSPFPLWGNVSLRPWIEFHGRDTSWITLRMNCSGKTVW